MIKISICMVSLNCWDVLKECIGSIEASLPEIQYEIIIVDNNSSDCTCVNIKNNYPKITLICNDQNVGFTKASNQAIRQCSGEFILWLNTDTIIMPDTLNKLINFMDAKPDCGIVGPKVLNADGSFQAQCRRGMPTPMASFFYMFRLNKIWPNNKTIGGYLLSYLPVDEENEVISVSGCCLFARHKVWDQIGPLDESILGFGEDIDWCVRARNAGWKVWYNPAAEIIHLKGLGGVHVYPYHKVLFLHQAMWIFYKKHLKKDYNLLVSIIIYAGIKLSCIISYAGIYIKRIFMPSKQ